MNTHDTFSPEVITQFIPFKTVGVESECLYDKSVISMCPLFGQPVRGSVKEDSVLSGFSGAILMYANTLSTDTI